MSLHASASEKNVRYSLRRYLITTLETGKSRNISFDLSGLDPSVFGVSAWLVVKIGNMNRGGLSVLNVEIYCCTRGDADGVLLATLSDEVFEVMTDPSMPDGKRRIALYDPTPTEIGKLLIQGIHDGEEMPAADKTKYKVITCICKWVAKA